MLRKLLAIYGRSYPVIAGDFEELYFSTERPGLSFVRRRRVRPLLRFLAHQLRMPSALNLLCRAARADAAFNDMLSHGAAEARARQDLDGS